MGQAGIEKQAAFIKAIPNTNVKLFSPSDLGYKIEGHRAQMPALAAKATIEQAARDAGIPTTVIRPGNFAESTLAVG